MVLTGHRCGQQRPSFQRPSRVATESCRAHVQSTPHLLRVPSMSNPGLLSRQGSPARRSMLREPLPARHWNPRAKSSLPPIIKKHFVRNKARQSIYIPQPGRSTRARAAPLDLSLPVHRCQRKVQLSAALESTVPVRLPLWHVDFCRRKGTEQRRAQWLEGRECGGRPGSCQAELEMSHHSSGDNNILC